MAVIDTGWVEVANGETTQLVIPEGVITQARIRWKGKSSEVEEFDETESQQGDNLEPMELTGKFSRTPADKPGWLLRYVTARSTIDIDDPGGDYYLLAEAPERDGLTKTSTGTGATLTQVSPMSPDTRVCYHSFRAFETGGSYLAKGTAYWHRFVDLYTENPQVTIDGNVTNYVGLLEADEASDYQAVTGLVAGSTNDILHAVTGGESVLVQIEVTYTPPCDAVLISPEAFGRATTETLVFEMWAEVPSGNNATVYFPKLSYCQDSDLSGATVVDSSSDQTDWEYWDGAAWQSLTSAGCPIAKKCRYNVDTSSMAMGRWYWAVEVWDDDTELWGDQSSIRQFRMVLSIDIRVACEIDSVDQTANVRAVRISETRNGELGSMSFQLHVAVGGTPPVVGDAVVMAVRDVDGHDEQFEGWVAEIPARITARIYGIQCKMPDSILAERYILEDYASQDVGLTLKAIVDDYCMPLDSSGIDTSTGFSRPVDAFGKTALDVFKEIGEQYGLLFWVNSTDLVVYLVSPVDIKGVTLHVLRGRAS